MEEAGGDLAHRLSRGQEPGVRRLGGRRYDLHWLLPRRDFTALIRGHRITPAMPGCHFCVRAEIHAHAHSAALWQHRRIQHETHEKEDKNASWQASHAVSIHADFYSVNKVPPWEFLHIVRFGQPGTPMPSWIDWAGSDQGAAKFGLHAQFEFSGRVIILSDGFESGDLDAW